MKLTLLKYVGAPLTILWHSTSEEHVFWAVSLWRIRFAQVPVVPGKKMVPIESGTTRTSGFVGVGSVSLWGMGSDIKTQAILKLCSMWHTVFFLLPADQM